jgi:hypothetical protein
MNKEVKAQYTTLGVMVVSLGLGVGLGFYITGR